jgi:hypothetical protein
VWTWTDPFATPPRRPGHPGHTAPVAGGSAGTPEAPGAPQRPPFTEDDEDVPLHQDDALPAGPAVASPEFADVVVSLCDREVVTADTCAPRIRTMHDHSVRQAALQRVSDYYFCCALHLHQVVLPGACHWALHRVILSRSEFFAGAFAFHAAAADRQSTRAPGHGAISLVGTTDVVTAGMLDGGGGPTRGLGNWEWGGGGGGGGEGGWVLVTGHSMPQHFSYFSQKPPPC